MQGLTIARSTSDISITVYDMRQSGATLQQIADKIGRTKERVRQILIKNYGSTEHQLISGGQLCRRLGLPKGRIIELCQGGVISPVAEWDTGNRHYLLFSPAVAEQVDIYYKTHRLCKVCHRPIARGRKVYCSKQCFKESRKYKYKSAEAKQRQLRNVKRYRERHKQMAQAAVRFNPEHQPEPLVVGEVARQDGEAVLALHL